MVTIFAVWLGWELNFIRQRKAMRKWIEANGWVSTASEASPDLPVDKQLFDPSPRSVHIPVWRRLLGDEAIAYVGIGKESPSAANWHSAKRLFPEAYWWDDETLDWRPPLRSRDLRMYGPPSAAP